MDEGRSGPWLLFARYRRAMPPDERTIPFCPFRGYANNGHCFILFRSAWDGSDDSRFSTAAMAGRFYPMVDLLLGLAFVAMVLTPAIVASLHRARSGSGDS
jgi:hypothetical protein